MSTDDYDYDEFDDNDDDYDEFDDNDDDWFWIIIKMDF